MGRCHPVGRFLYDRDDRLVLSTSSTQSAIGAFPGRATQFGGSLPRGLREEIALSHTSIPSPETLHMIYAPPSGPLRLGQWRCTDPERPATRLGPQARNYQATLAVGDRIGTSTAAASGPVAALTAMLHDRGVVLEMNEFHQRRTDGGTATYVRGTDGVHTEWAMGVSEDATQSALRAMIACANRLQAAD